MSARSYYRWALALPLLVPALLSPLMLLDPAPAGVRVVMLFLSWSVLIGGVPYVLFAIGFLLWMRGRPNHAVRKGIYMSPLVFAVWLMVCLSLFLAVDGTLGSSSEFVGLFAIFGVVFGYGYVGLAEVGRALLFPIAAPPAPAPAA